jgi:hypothetical protein
MLQIRNKLGRFSSVASFERIDDPDMLVARPGSDASSRSMTRVRCPTAGRSSAFMRRASRPMPIRTASSPGPDGNFDVGEYSAGNIPVVTADGKLVRKHTPTTHLASPRRWAVENPSGR